MVGGDAGVVRVEHERVARRGTPGDGDAGKTADDDHGENEGPRLAHEVCQVTGNHGAGRGGADVVDQ